MKTIIITGVSGFIGSNVARYYLNKKYKVIGISRSEFELKNKNYEFIQIDLNRDQLDEIFIKYRPQYFIHCASSASVGASVENPEYDFESSVSVLYKILFTLKRVNINIKFIFLSSAAVYGDPKKIPISEDDEISPISPYGLNKKICEEICEYFIKNECMDIKILRIFSVYGIGLKKQILWDINKKIKNYNSLELFGTGYETRDFLNVQDLIQIIDLILNFKTKEYIFNVANGEQINIRNLAEIFLKNRNLSYDILKFNNMVKNGDPLNWKADISKIKALGYRKQINIENGIKNYIEWLDENKL